MELENIIGDYTSFLEDLLNRTKSAGIDLQNYPIDHIGYRVETTSEYESKKADLKALSLFFGEKIYHNRPISRFILKEPIRFSAEGGKNYSIDLIELPSPKKEKSYPTDLEHIEVVVGSNLEEFINTYKELWSKIDDSNIYNKTAELTFDNNKTIKFHKLSLVEVIKLEASH